MLDPCSKLARLAAKGTPLAPGTSPAHFTLRRNVASRQGSVLALGESANLDFNRYTGCAPNLTRFGCTFSAPFAGAFLPDPTREHWVDIISAAPPFKYCRRIPLGSAEAPRRRIQVLQCYYPSCTPTSMSGTPSRTSSSLHTSSPSRLPRSAPTDRL